MQEADYIYIAGLKKYDLYDKVWQAGAILLNVQSVGVMGDERTYEEAVVLRAVGSTDGMTADWSQLPYKFLAKISNEIINSFLDLKLNIIKRDISKTISTLQIQHYEWLDTVHPYLKLMNT